MTRTNNDIKYIIRNENGKLKIEQEQTIEIWNGMKMAMSDYQKTMESIKQRIEFMTPKGE